MDSTGSSSNMLAQLNNARALALGDASHYQQILPAVSPITGSNAAVELRRWGADFIAETFASPVLPADIKQQLALGMLDRLKEYIDPIDEDPGVVKSAVQAAASVYPLIFRHIIRDPTDGATWQKMTGIKSNILRRMDNATPGVRICCLKFAQRVVQTQTPGVISDPRRPDHNEISLALVPRDHPLIPPANLEAEASGLLDRLLGILQEDISDALLVTATINGLGSLVRNRASVANKIITQILNFNPVKLVNSPMTPKTKVMVKSMEKTTRALLVNVMKKNPENPMNSRIHQYVERMERMRKDFLSDNLKRPAPAEPTDGLDQNKRQRLGVPTAPVPIAAQPPQLTMSYAQLFSVTEDPALRAIDVTTIPIDIVSRIVVPLLQYANDQKMEAALNTVRSRLLELGKARQQHAQAMAAAAAAAPQPVADDDDDYEPDFQPEDAEQILNRVDSSDARPIQAPELTLGTFKLPPPEPFTGPQLVETSKLTIGRVFGMVAASDTAARQKAPKAGFARLAASNYDRNSWITILTRLATRVTAGLEDPTASVKQEIKPQVAPDSIPNTVRDTLLRYVVDDFRRRIDVAIQWLSEEWYNDKLVAKARQAEEGNAAQTQGDEDELKNYLRCTKRVMDGILPYLDLRDKALIIRFLGEVPAVTKEMIEKVKVLAADPERLDLVVSTLHYLILVRPPVRDICIDAIEDMHHNYDGAQSRTKKVLQRWRPQGLTEEAAATDAGGAVGGAASATPTEAAPVVKAEA